jgi:hypothetical protein
MNHQIKISMLVLTLCGSPWLAHATESALHNDMDGDGRSDLVWRNATTGAIVYWSGANAAMATTVRATHLAYNVASDFDLRRMTIAFTLSDAFTDPSRRALLAQDARNGANFVLFPEDIGSGYSVYGMWAASLGTIAVGTGDFNGDGSADVLYRTQGNGRNFMVADAAWGDWASYYPLASVTNPAWKVAGVGDFNGDGRSDILWRNAVTGANAIWRSANAETQQPVARVANLSWHVVAVADFNGDGKSDIFWRNTSTGANAIWNSGNSTTQRAVAGVTNQRWRVTATGDFNGDGRFDLFWRNSGTGANVIWKSANAATQQGVVGVSNQAWSTVR